MNLRNLYQQMILDHNKHPKNFGRLSGATHSAEGYNPLCGDHYWVDLDVKDGLIKTIAFEGQGCAISKASASMMTAALKGQPTKQAETIFQQFIEMITKPEVDKQAEPFQERLASLQVFGGVRQFPARVKCASLPWHTFKTALEKRDRVSTE